MKKISEEDLLKIKQQIAYVTNYYRKRYNVKITSNAINTGLLLTMKFDRFPDQVGMLILTDEFEQIYIAFGAEGFANYWQDKLNQLWLQLDFQLRKYGVQI